MVRACSGDVAGVSYPCTCKLDGVKKQVRYHMACKIGEYDWWDPKIYDYIGDGVIYSAMGVLQLGETRLSFFKLRPDRPNWAR